MQPDWRSLSRSLARLAGHHRRQAALVGAGVALAYWVLQLSLPHVLGALEDDAVYVALGKAIATGHGYHSIYAVGQPVHQKYPPGLPLIYAGLWRLGRSLPAVIWLTSALSVLVTATAAGLVWWIARARLGLHPVVALVCAIGPFLMDGAILYFSLPISEPYFVLGWAGCLVLAYRLQDRATPGRAVALGAVAAGTTLVRTEGVALIAGLLLALLVLRISWRGIAAYLAAAVAPLVAWIWLHARMLAAGPISTQPDELPYMAWLPLHSLGDAARLAAASLRLTWHGYWQLLPPYFSDVRPAALVAMAVCLALAIAGGVLLARRHPALPATVLAAAAVLLLWPWPQDRFVFSRLPFAGLLMGAAVQAGVRRAVPGVRRLAYAALVLFAAAIAARGATLRQFAYMPANTQAILGTIYPGQFIAANARFVPVVSQWLLAHTAPDDRVLVDSPAAIYLYTGRHTVAEAPAGSAIAPSIFSRPGRYLASRIRDDSVSVVVLTDVTHDLARDIIMLFRRCPGTLQPIGNARWWGASRAFFYRVARRDACVEAVSDER
jgi:hypothetical protein